MKKKFIPMSLAVAAACIFALAACSDKNDKPDGNYATSISAEEVTLDREVSGWKLTDITEENRVDRYCIELFIYVDNTTFRYKAADFTVNGVSPDSITPAGAKKTLDNDFTFLSYLFSLKSYSVEETYTEAESATEYTETTKSVYVKTTSGEIGGTDNFIQRFVLEFENPVLSSSLKFENVNINKIDPFVPCPSSYYAIPGYDVQMFTFSECSVTYGTTIKHYTPYQKQHTLTKNVIKLNGVNLKINTAATTVEASDFSIRKDNGRYLAASFYTGKQQEVNLNTADLGDEYTDKSKWHKLKCDGEVIISATSISAVDANDFFLIFEKLETVPQTLTIYYKAEEIVVV